MNAIGAILESGSASVASAIEIAGSVAARFVTLTSAGFRPLKDGSVETAGAVTML